VVLSRRRDDSGMVAVFTVLVVTFVALPLLALVVDLGIARTATGQAGTAADSAALAAAVRLGAGGDQAGAVAVAQQFVQDNFGVKPAAWATCLDPHPLPAGTPATPGDCVSIDEVLRRIRVTVPPHAVPSVFSGVLGTAPPAASATSTASWGDSAPPCALCVVTSAGASGNFVGGIDRTRIVGGDVVVGGAISVGVGGSLSADAGQQITFALPPAPVSVLPPATQGTAPADPLASALAAVQTEAARARPGTPSGACDPGIYADFSRCTSFTGNGVYVVTGNPFIPGIPTNVTVTAPISNAVIYVTCTKLYVSAPQPQPCNTSGVTVKPSLVASGSQTISGSAAFGGLALAFDPTAQATQRLASRGTLQIDGSVDGPATTFRDSGSCTGRLLINGRLVAGAVTLVRCTSTAGSPALTVTAPAAAAVPAGVRLVPSTP
jgi:hypothetical protein